MMKYLVAKRKFQELRELLIFRLNDCEDKIFLGSLTM